MALDVKFDQFDLDGYNGPVAALQWGPDGRLYVAERFGSIKVLTVAEDGGAYKVTASETIELIKSIPNHDDDGTAAPQVDARQMTGIAVGGTADAVEIYVSSSDPRIGAGGGGQDKNLDTNSGVVSRLSVNEAGAWEKVDLVRGLPRSEENHSTNGLALDEETGTLYVAQGGHTNAGAPSNNFAGQSEYAYSAAILKVDLGAIEAMPVQSDPVSGQAYVYDLPTLDDPTRENVNGITDPNDPGYDGIDVNDVFGGNDGLNQAKITADSPVQVYSPGYRNPYDVLLTEDGKLYTYDNGANAGWGGHPVDANGNLVTGAGQDAQNAPSENGGVKNYDNLHQIEAGTYGGHPNPTRAEGADAGLWSSPNNGTNGAAPLDGDDLPADFDTVIPEGSADPRQGVYKEGGFADGAIDTGKGSVNGLAEYTSGNAFGGALKGAILATDYNGDVYLIPRDAAGTVETTTGNKGQTVAEGKQVVKLGGGGSLGIDAVGDDHPFAGTVWVGQLADGKIRILAPGDGTAGGGGIGDDGDADDDGLNDKVDPFALDADNGAGTVIAGGKTLAFDFESGSNPGTFGGAGFTGAMTNGGDAFEDGGLIDVDNIIAGGAGGTVQIKSVGGGDAYQGKNDQKDALQFGVTLDESVGEADITLTMKNWIPAATPGGGYPSAGLVIGTGDQDNYLKLVLGARGDADGFTQAMFEQGVENDGKASNKDFTDNALLDPGQADWVQLRLSVDPEAGTVLPSWRYGTGELPGDAEAGFVEGETITLPADSDLLKAVRDAYAIDGVKSALSVGLVATSNAGTPFTADFDGITIATTVKEGYEAPAEDDDVVAAINAGGAAYTDANGVVFAADTKAAPSAALAEGASKTYDTKGDIAGTEDDALYQTERYGADFGYDIELATPGTYEVELHFAELYQNADGKRVFDVEIEGEEVVSNLDLHKLAGHDGAYVVTKRVEVEDGNLDIDFKATDIGEDVDNAKIGAIVVRAVETATPDTDAPTAGLSVTPPMIVTEAGAFEVQVTYADASGIDADTIDAADLIATGPGGTVAGVALVGTTVNADGSLTATYAIDDPNGDGWDTGDNGTYELKLAAGEVADGAGNAAAEETPIGNFEVEIEAEIPTVEEGPFKGIATPDAYADSEVGRAVVKVTPGKDDVQASNYGNNSFTVENLGDKKIAAVYIDVSDALYPDTVFDPYGVAGDSVAKALQINSGKNATGAVVPDGAYIGEGGAKGFEGLLVAFSEGDGFENGEKVGFSVDMDPNSIAGMAKSTVDQGTLPAGWDVGGVSGAELIGAEVRILFTDGSTATAQLHGDESQAGSQALVQEGEAGPAASLDVGGLDADGRYGGTPPTVVVGGPEGATVRVVMTKGIQPVANPDVADQVEAALEGKAFPANNAVEFQTLDVVIPTGGTVDVSDLFDYANDPNGYVFAGNDTLPIGFVAAVVDEDSGLPLGPVTRPVYAVSNGTPVGGDAGGETVSTLAVTLKADADLSRFNIVLDGETVLDKGKLDAGTEKTYTFEVTGDGAAKGLAVEHFYDTAKRALDVVEVSVDGVKVDLGAGTVFDGRKPIVTTDDATPTINYNGVFELDLDADLFGGDAGGGDTGGGTVNTAPVAVDDVGATEADRSVTIDVLGNDTDAENDALSIAEVAQPTRGAVRIEDGKLVFDAQGDFDGLAAGESTTETFGYKVTDGDLTDTGEVTVTIEGVNEGDILVPMPTTSMVKVTLGAGADLSRFNVLIDGETVLDRGLLKAESEDTFVFEIEDDGAAHAIEVEHFYDTANRALDVVGVEVDGVDLDLAGGTVFDGRGPIVTTDDATPTINYNGVFKLGLDADLF